MIKIETCVDYGYMLGDAILKGSLMNCKYQEAVILFPGPSNALKMPWQACLEQKHKIGYLAASHAWSQ